MKRYNSTLIKMTRRLGMAIAALLMLSTMASCSDQDSQVPATGDEAYLNLSFSTASNTTSRASRAGDIGKDDETQANPNTESDIHSIKVWVFKSGTGEKANPIAYKEDRPTADGGGTVNGTYTLNLRFLRKINGEDIKNIDLYILANSESTNMAEKLEGKDLRSITREDLQGVTFDYPFGITKDGKAQTTEVPNGKGLPISRAITNIAIDGHVADTEAGAKNIGISIPLVRAVSKLHFYFARKDAADAMTENVKVTGIEIDGNTFPTASYVFPDEEEYTKADANKAATSSKYGTLDYEPTALQLGGVENSGIKAVADPTKFIKKNSQTAQEYLNAFKDAKIDSHHLSYLRDTNKPITGTIYYQLAEGGSVKSQGFTIPSSSAIRNRELVVYGYFLQGGALCLDLQPIVSDWDDNIAWDYTDKVNIKMEREEGKFGKAVEVHYGIPNGGGPAITLNIDTGNKNWILQCDNPDFAFYVNEKTYDTVSKSDIKGDTFTFHVVPKRNKDLAVERNFDTNVFIVLAPDMRKVLFNVGEGELPGNGFNIKFTQGDDRSGI